jgi:hypothetical protein
MLQPRKAGSLWESQRFSAGLSQPNACFKAKVLRA